MVHSHSAPDNGRLDGTVARAAGRTDAHLVLAECPGREFQGGVVRSAEAIDAETRSLLAEVNLANKEGVLLPGGYPRCTCR